MGMDLEADYLFDGLSVLWDSESGPDGIPASLLAPGTEDDLFASLLDDELFAGAPSALAAAPFVPSTAPASVPGAIPAPPDLIMTAQPVQPMQQHGQAAAGMTAPLAMPALASAQTAMKLEPDPASVLQPGWQWPNLAADAGSVQPAAPAAATPGWAKSIETAQPCWPGPTTQLQLPMQPEPVLVPPEQQLKYERRDSTTSSGGSGSKPSTSPTNSGGTKQGAKRSRKKSSGAGVAVGGGGACAGSSAAKPSRWGQRKAALRTLEEELAKRASEAHEVETLNRRLKLRTTAMQHAVDARDKQLEILAAYRASSAAEGKGKPQSAEVIQAAAIASLDVLSAKLRSFVAEATMMLLQLDAQPPGQQAGADVHSKLSEMVIDLCGELGVAFVLNPRMQFEALGIRVDRHKGSSGSTAALPWGPRASGCAHGEEGPPPGHWERVAMEVRATPEQLDVVTACWELNTQLLSRLQSEIEAAHNQLAEGLACSTEAKCGDRGSASAPTGLVGLQRDLASSMLKQGISCRAISFILFTKVLTPIQTARVIVHSFPYFPNAREIATRMMMLRK